MSTEVVARDKKMFPAATWLCGSIYDIPLPAATFDSVYAYFVLEHFVYPARALDRMVSLARPRGAVTLVFPDCIEMRRLGSQALGFIPGRAFERLRHGDPINALFNLYESRLRLPRALARVVEDHGPFPVNLNPRCLVDPELIQPDVDQVYISSKREVQQWAEANGLRVEFPAGVHGSFRETALVQIILP
jgi:hypothetical protein